MRSLRLTVALLAAFVATSVLFAENESLAQRTPFAIPLIRLKVAEGPDDGNLREVQVEIDEGKEHAVVARYNDMHVKVTRTGIRKTEYGESAESSFMITQFEAEQVDRVVQSLIETLEILEKDLKKRRWDRCLHLDAYLPRFLKAFYFLVCSARNSQYALPRIGRIPESAFDVSLSSPKSDARVAMWQAEAEHLIKLRIITREFIYQLREWQKRELRNPARNPEIAYSEKAEEAYGLFVKMYFNLKPPPDVPTRGQHL